jgi:hypothetical protein
MCIFLVNKNKSEARVTMSSIEWKKIINYKNSYLHTYGQPGNKMYGQALYN